MITRRFNTISIFVLSLSFLHMAHAKKCNLFSLQTEICEVMLDQIHPTQFAIGKLAIDEKMKKLETLDHQGKIKLYLKKRFAPAIIGPDLRYYIIDRHHLAYSVLHAHISRKSKVLYLKIIHNWSALSLNDFSKKMISQNYVWLKDQDHQKKSFFELPKHLILLADDPYRSLAGLVRESGGFRKVSVMYQEFYWAIFLKKQGIVLKTSDAEDVKSALSYAMELASSPKATHLPGYLPPLTHD